MKKIIIIGGGFAGLSALKRLSRAKKNLNITLIDIRKKFNFLPMLPDIIGRGISADLLTFDLKEFSDRAGVKFLNDEVKSIDIEQKKLNTSKAILSYDYLIIASGSETNFYGNEAVEKYGFKLDDIEDAKRILTEAARANFDTFIISGGGYTGVEIATNLRRFFFAETKTRKL